MIIYGIQKLLHLCDIIESDYSNKNVKGEIETEKNEIDEVELSDNCDEFNDGQIVQNLDLEISKESKLDSTLQSKDLTINSEISVKSLDNTLETKSETKKSEISDENDEEYKIITFHRKFYLLLIFKKLQIK